MNKVKRITIDAMLAAIALGIFVLEASLPPIAPIPGIKPGLSNIVTLVALYRLKKSDAAAILFVRVFLGAVCTGNVMALFYSAAGGVLAFIIMALLRRLFPEKLMFVNSVFGALAHNAGQIIVAVFMTRTWAICMYYPILACSGIITGLFTGYAAKFLCTYLDKSGVLKE